MKKLTKNQHDFAFTHCKKCQRQQYTQTFNTHIFSIRVLVVTFENVVDVEAPIEVNRIHTELLSDSRVLVN